MLMQLHLDYIVVFFQLNKIFIVHNKIDVNFMSIFRIIYGITNTLQRNIIILPLSLSRRQKALLKDHFLHIMCARMNDVMNVKMLQISQVHTIFFYLLRVRYHYE